MSTSGALPRERLIWGHWKVWCWRAMRSVPHLLLVSKIPSFLYSICLRVQSYSVISFNTDYIPGLTLKMGRVPN